MKYIYTCKNILLLMSMLILISCSNDDNSSEAENTEFAVREYSFDTDANSKLMFRDGEDQELMTSETRRYEIGKIIRVKPIDAFTIEVANFAPVDIENVFIIADIEGVGSKIKLFKINKIRAHAKQEIKYSFLSEETQFINVNGVMVDLSDYSTEGILADKVTFDFMGESELVKKLKTLSKLKWDIRYHDFDENNNPDNNWSDDISAKDIRRFSGMIINLGYIFASEAFEEGFLKEHLIKNDGAIVMTSEEKKELYQKLINKEFLKCGKVVNVSGLGGGSTFGVAEHILRDYLTKKTGHITAHEFGHCLGYNHSSNMTYPIKVEGIKTGIAPLTNRIIEDMFSKKAFPVDGDNYYKSTDLE
ncbi:hypothetical protein [Aquimarina sp. AU58]|uniref:hypothetical protein n=1 Tax=Aquimarina sp. AU58 TaxID=1874112 RepID=UPI00135C34DC|nr:hypothetical protein [Aquimarina sp. AU58]